MNHYLAFRISNSIPSVYPGSLWTHQGSKLTGRSESGESWTLTRIGPNHYKATGATADGTVRSDAECVAMASYLADVEAQYDRECASSIAYHHQNQDACA